MEVTGDGAAVGFGMQVGRDMVEGILVQGERMKDVVAQLQLALYPRQVGTSTGIRLQIRL